MEQPTQNIVKGVFRVERTRSGARVFLDGNEFQDVTSYSIHHGAGDIPKVSVSLLVNRVEFVDVDHSDATPNEV